MPMGFISAPGPLELIVILVIALIVLGPAKLPEAARSVGRGMRELRESSLSVGDNDDEGRDHTAPQSAPRPAYQNDAVSSTPSSSSCSMGLV